MGKFKRLLKKFDVIHHLNNFLTNNDIYIESTLTTVNGQSGKSTGVTQWLTFITYVVFIYLGYGMLNEFFTDNGVE